MLTYGTDPEFFSCVNGNAISPALLQVESGIKQIGGNIKHPIYIDNPDFYWMGDGAAWETGFKKPFSSAKELHKALAESLEVLEEYLSKVSWQGSKLELVKKPVVSIEPEIYMDYLMRENELVTQGFIFGCDKDEDAIIENYQCKTIDVTTHPYRYSGGHWHIGVENVEFIHSIIIPFIQLQAILLGNVGISQSKYLELEKIRANTYGTPGRFRPQKWGTEYRALSNSWCEDLETVELLVEGSEKAYELLLNPEKAKPIIAEFLPKTIKSISDLDQAVCRSIYNEVLNV